MSATARTVQLARTLQRYLALDQGGKCLATYVWIDGTGENVRGKTRTLNKYPCHPQELPIWNFDGSSTGQSNGHDSDIYLKPSSIYRDPFIPGDNVLVLCETLDPKGEPTATNHRASCLKAMEKVKDTKPWFGLEQEYTLVDTNGHPFGWPRGGYPRPQGPYYCGVGADRVFGRQIMDSHYKACLYAGLEVPGTNVEVMPSQFEFQIGPCEGIDASDQLWIARYILHRVAEDFDACVSLDPKPMSGDWNGAGAHCNFSTEDMRKEGGIGAIKSAVDKLSAEHKRHIECYDPNGGEDNKRRLTGRHETASIDSFSSGVADRGASIRIPRQVNKDGRGYLEDRRPSSNCDPYQVTEAIVKTAILNQWQASPPQ